MKKLALAASLAAAMLVASAPAKASPAFWPWGFVGFELINIGVAQAGLVVCQGRIAQNPQEWGYSAIPIMGPLQAWQSCAQRRAPAR